MMNSISNVFVSKSQGKCPWARSQKQRVFVEPDLVDDHGLTNVLRRRAKAGPETKQNKFPIVETYREQIDGKYGFQPPTTNADDDVDF
jgi:hypothetical protein